MTLSQELLEEQEVAYEAEEDQYAEEIERLETLPPAFDEGTWTWDDLEWIVRWKMTGSPFVEKVLDDFNSNDETFVTSQIEKTVAASSPGEKLTHLTEITGVTERMGSAFLLFMNPDRFTVFDERAWNVLQETGYLRRELSEDPNVDEYLIYLGACWTLANEYDVCLRTLDRALWVLDIEGESTTSD
jgi:hypothetical protein